jgi:hypothetical protein
MTNKDKEQYKVLSDIDRKRYDEEKKLLKHKLKKRELKEKEKKIVKVSSLEDDLDEEKKDDSSAAIRPENLNVNKSGDIVLSPTLIYQNVADVCAKDNGVFTIEASTSTVFLQSLE